MSYLLRIAVLLSAIALSAIDGFPSPLRKFQPLNQRRHLSGLEAKVSRLLAVKGTELSRARGQHSSGSSSTGSTGKLNDDSEWNIPTEGGRNERKGINLNKNVFSRSSSSSSRVKRSNNSSNNNSNSKASNKSILVDSVEASETEYLLTDESNSDTNSSSSNGFRSGFVSILGNANMGKSTLMNRLLQQQLCITSPKPQTTRHRILGVLTEPAEKYQLVFSDTPGMLTPVYQLQEAMQDTIRGAAGDADTVLLVTDVFGEPLVDEEVLRKLAVGARPIIIAVNKMDLAPDFNTWTAFMQRSGNFSSSISSNSSRGDSVAPADVSEKYAAFYQQQHPQIVATKPAAAASLPQQPLQQPRLKGKLLTSKKTKKEQTQVGAVNSAACDATDVADTSSSSSSLVEGFFEDLEQLTGQRMSQTPQANDRSSSSSSSGRRNRKQQQQQDEIRSPLSLYQLQQMWKQYLPTAEVLGISARDEIGISVVLDRLLAHTSQGPQYFPTETLTNRDERFFTSEIIRETLFALYKDEIPYSCEVVIDSFHDKNERLSVIEAGIIVTRQSQQGILIGAGGSKLKELGSIAREKLEKFLDRRVFLSLRVRVDQDWRSKKESLTKYGYLDSDFA